MDHQRPLIVAALLLATSAGLLGAAHAQAPPAPEPEVAATAAPEEPTPIESRPYRIELHLASDASARMDASRRRVLLAGWLEMVRRFIGEPWAIQVAEHPNPLVGEGLERLDAGSLGDFGPTVDKAWLVWISVDPEDCGLVFSGREYDAATRWLGPLQRRKAVSPLDAPRTLFRFTLDLFSPSALIVGQEGGRALLKVQGAAIPPAGELGAVAPKGTTFIPIRLVTARDDSILINRIAYTYLTVESLEGSIARCAIISAFRDPLSQRIARPNTLTALGVKPGDSALHLRFLDKTTREPAAGYTLTERPASDGPARNVGMTDRSGRIEVTPGPTRGVVKLRLLAGDSEPLAEFPIMPGESVEEREITVDPLPLAARYQVQLDALRDSIVDQVALRARLERLMQSRLEGEDWAGLQALLKQYDLLPPATSFAATLKSLKDEATKTSYEATKTTVLTRNLQAQFGELEGLIDGYLGDEASKAFAEAIREKNARTKAEQAVKKPAPSPIPDPAPAPTPKPAAPKAAAPQLGAPRADTP